MIEGNSHTNLLRDLAGMPHAFKELSCNIFNYSHPLQIFATTADAILDLKKLMPPHAIPGYLTDRVHAIYAASYTNLKVYVVVPVYYELFILTDQHMRAIPKNLDPMNVISIFLAAMDTALGYYVMQSKKGAAK